MATFYKGKYKVKNPEKYVRKAGLNDIVYRSSWELFVMKWCDKNPDVISWGSEEVIIPYISKVDNKRHRYFLDFYIKFKNNKIYLVEVKPKYQTAEPKPGLKKSKKKLLSEVTTYATNVSKWAAARAFAVERNAEFHIWTEDDLEKLGMKVNVSKKFRYVKFANKKRKSNAKKRKSV